VHLYVEPLELRSLPSGGPPAPPTLEVHPDDTLDQAAGLGTLNPGGSLQAAGVIGDGTAGAADVDWYQFTLDQPLEVTLQAANPAGPAPAPVVLSLYNSDPTNFTDPSMLLGTRLLVQSQATATADASIDRQLSAGTYYVAVSGAGNLYFHPFLAGSGYDGQTGPYTLNASGTDLGLNPATDGPVVLTTDPAPNAVLASSPAYLHIGLSSALDTSTTPQDQIVQLTYRSDGQFDGTEPPLPLADVQYSPVTNEILVLPSGPLVPGYYNLSLIPINGSGIGNPSNGPTDFTTPQPWQQTWSMTFRVAGVEGNTWPGAVADDTPAGAHQLADITRSGLVQATGYIGDDPTAPAGVKAAADVDLYHFQVSGPGPYALTAEAFAGRIGSTLNPALSLFRLDPATQQLVLVASNNNTLNPIAASNNLTLPLRRDSALFVGLTAGDYYVAVSSSKNVPDPLRGIKPGQLVPGVGRIFDPNVSHSGTAGSTTGGYVLNLLVQQEQQTPRVLASTPADGATLDGPPTQLQVTFSEPVNLPQLAYLSFHTTSQGGMPAVFIKAADGTRYSPRFESLDPTTNTASLLMLDALPNGTYELHLSGAGGLADMAGDPLAGNDPSGDYVVRFSVSGPARGTGGNPLTWNYVGSAAATVHDQSLGTLFPDELQAGVNIVRQPLAGAARPAQADAYDFEVLQQQQYLFLLSGMNLPAGVSLSLQDANGNPVGVSLQGGTALKADLQPGSYRVLVQGWAPGQAAGAGYQLTINLLGSADTPVPLTSGPAPAIRLRLHETITPPPPSIPAPPTSGGSSGSTTGASSGSSQPPPTSGGSSGSTTDSGSGPSQPPPRLSLPVVEGTPDNPGLVSTVPATWAGGGQPTPAAARVVGPIPPAFVALGLVSKLPPANAVEPAGPAVARASLPEGAGPAHAAGVPFNLLAVLGTSPTGSLASTNGAGLTAPPPRVVLQLPEPPVVDGLMRLILFTPLIPTGGEDEAAAVPVPDDRGQAPSAPISADGWWRDFWFSRLGSLTRGLAAMHFLTPLEARLGAIEDAGRGAGDEPIDETPAPPPDESAAAGDRAWALALLGAVAGVGLDRRQHAGREPVWGGALSGETRA
jgi:hypothetical protein